MTRREFVIVFIAISLFVAFAVFASVRTARPRLDPQIVIAPTTTSTTVLGVLCFDANGFRVRTDAATARARHLDCTP